jgi:hypothetical protein
MGENSRDFWENKIKELSFQERDVEVSRIS